MYECEMSRTIRLHRCQAKTTRFRSLGKVMAGTCEDLVDGVDGSCEDLVDRVDGPCEDLVDRVDGPCGSLVDVMDGMDHISSSSNSFIVS